MYDLDLSTVPEDPTILYPELDNNDSGEENQAAGVAQFNQKSQPLSKSPGGVSAFSGTTARSSHSAQEFSDLDFDDMVQGLRELSQSSDEILKFLVSSEISEAAVEAVIGQLQTKDSRTKKTLNRLVTVFSAHREIYGSESYIDHRELLRMLLGERGVADDDVGSWRPDALLQKANLAFLALGVSSHFWQDQDIQFLEELENMFPGPFITRLVPSDAIQNGSSVLIEETFHLALQLRTQYAIRIIVHQAADPHFDFDVTLHQVFFKDAKNLRGWGTSGLQSGDLTKDNREAIVSRLNQLRSAFMDSSDTVLAATDLLQHKFSPIALTTQVLSWISRRLKEINDEIRANGDSLEISKALKDEVDRARTAKSSVKNEGNSDQNSPQIHLDFEPPSEVSNLVLEPLTKKRATRTKSLKSGQFKYVHLYIFNSTVMTLSSCYQILTLCGSANSPKAIQTVAALKRFEGNRRAALAAEESSSQPTQQRLSAVQVSATAVPIERALPPTPNIDGPRIASSAPAELTDQRAAETQEDDSWRPQDAGDDDDLLPAEVESHVGVSELNQFGSQVFTLKNRRQAESNKENIATFTTQAEPQIRNGQKRRIIDRQPGAQREEFHETQELNLNPAVQDREDTSSDEVFEQLEVPRVPSARRRPKPVRKHFSSQRLGSQGSSPGRTRDQNTSGSSRPRIVPERISDEPPTPQPMSLYRIANTMAKERKTLQQRTKRPQTRTAWSEDETNQLLSLIEEHGISWSLLMAEDKTTGRFLQDRNQVALKDKARNIKVDYLRCVRRRVPMKAHWTKQSIQSRSDSAHEF